MTIGRYCGEVSVECDTCGEELTETELDVEGFEGLLAAIKADGWRIEQVAGQWVHTCPDCQ